MKLSRTGCYGKCPAYSIEIHADGTAIYTGKDYVSVPGERREHLSTQQVEELVEAFRKANYFSLKHKYVASVTDHPTYKTSFEVNGVKKSVVDYDGQRAGMPKAVTELEETIDRVVGTAKWIKGNAETAPASKQ